MFYNEDLTEKACEEEPSLIFSLIDEGHEEMVYKLIKENVVSLNTTNDNNDNVIMYMLKKCWYESVLKLMSKKGLDINHQNNEGDTFAHILVTKRYLDVMLIIDKLLNNRRFIPNIRNKKGETILDKSINNSYIYTTKKILEDERFNNIDLISFKNLYESYIKNDSYGVYSKVNNLDVILNNLSDKELLPKVEVLINTIASNIEKIKKELFKNQLKSLDVLIYGTLEESVM